MREYDVALSFAGEDRHHAERLAELLRAEEYSVFYDEYELAKLWGKDLYVYLSSVYKDQAEYCIMFLSKHYARKMWTNRERQSAQARAFEENQEYILPVRLDDTEIPGILPTVGYLDLRSMTIEQVHQVLVAKLSGATSQTSIIDISTSAVLESNSGDVITSQILERTEESMNKVFISYVSENIEIVDRLCQELKSHGIQVWLDRNDIDPGSHWEQAIRRAIRQGGVFIACFSEEYNNRDKTYMNEELTLAIDELRQRSTDRIWFVPVKLNECEIPDRDIGGGKTLQALQHVNLYEDWNSSIQRIVKVVQPGVSETINTNTVEQSSDQHAEAYYNRGVAYSGRGDYDRAIAHFTKTIELKPDFADAYRNRGVIYGIKGDVGRAIADFTKAIELNPNDADAYTNRGIAYRKKGDIDKAIKDYTTAIGLEPNHVEAYTNRSVAYGEKGDVDPAIEDYNKMIQLNPNDAAAYNNRGVAYGERGNFDRAIADYIKAIQLKPDFVEAYSNRGMAYGQKGDYDRAIADCDKAIQLKPDYARAYSHRGVTYNKRGNFDRAIADFNTAIELSPDDAHSYTSRSVAYREKGNFDRAIADCNKAIQLNSNDAEAYNNRGVAYGVKGDVERAIADFNKAVALKPNYAEAYSNRALAYNSKGNFDRAIADCNKAIQLNPNLDTAYNNRGVAYGNKGGVDRAIADFNRAIELNPNNTNAYNNLRAAQLNRT